MFGLTLHTSADLFAGRSLEEIDEIFGDVHIVHEADVKFPLGQASTVETVEVREGSDEKV